jgi:tetratricopeptide (TPR) repeat protein
MPMPRIPRLSAALRRVALIAAVLAGPAAAETANDKIKVLHDLIMNPDSRLSASDTLTMFDLVDAAPGSRDAGRIDHLRAVIEAKVGPIDDAIRHGENALTIDAAQPFLEPKERMHLEYDVGNLYLAKQDCLDAIPHYRKSITFMTTANGVTEDQKLGTEEQVAYCLHEVKDYAAARDLNQKVLDAGAILHGAHSPLLIAGLVNLAQNEYALGDHAAARASLERVLDIATTANDAEKVDVSLFQLGVLAFEDGRKDEAVKLMERRLELAKAIGNADRIAAAQAALDELHKKLGK